MEINPTGLEAATIAWRENPCEEWSELSPGWKKILLRKMHAALTAYFAKCEELGNDPWAEDSEDDDNWMHDADMEAR